jgi:hypothetical protein
VGGFRINPDGTVGRAPEFLKDAAAKAAENVRRAA